jgi:hypothetical protein
MGVSTLAHPEFHLNMRAPKMLAPYPEMNHKPILQAPLSRPSAEDCVSIGFGNGPAISPYLVPERLKPEAVFHRCNLGSSSQLAWDVSIQYSVSKSQLCELRSSEGTE